MGLEVPFPLSNQATSVFGPHFTAIRLHSDPTVIHMQAVGVNPTSGYRTFFYIGPELIFPPRLHFANTAPTGISLQVLTPYRVEFAYKYPPLGMSLPGIPNTPPASITIYTASGPVEVPITDEPNVVQSAGQLVSHDVESFRVQLKDFSAWIDMMPMAGKRFIVTGTVVTPTSGWHAQIVPQMPPGFNPMIKLLILSITPPTGAAAQHVTDVPVRYEEGALNFEYSDAEISYQATRLHLKVKRIW